MRALRLQWSRALSLVYEVHVIMQPVGVGNNWDLDRLLIRKKNPGETGWEEGDQKLHDKWRLMVCVQHHHFFEVLTSSPLHVASNNYYEDCYEDGNWVELYSMLS